MKKQKVAIIGTVGIPANYGGFETLAENLVENLNDEYDLTVYCSGKTYPKDVRKKQYKNARLKYIPLKANGIQSIFYDAWSILHALFYAEVLLILGVAGAWMLPFVRLFTNKKIIISIDGIEWQRDKWNWLAKTYLFWAESLAVKYSHIDISDNEAIQDYTAQRYGSLSRIIEYGANQVLQVKPTDKDKEKYSFLKRAYTFKVCRIEPENNIHLVLEAFAELPQKTLVMVGNWQKSEYGKNLKEKYRQFPNINLLEPIYEQAKLDVLRSNASLYIHGHSKGGTNPALVEAMFLGLPIITFDVSYNRVTTENKAFYFKDIEKLKAHILYNTPYTFRKIGKEMQAIAQRRYTWELIAEKYRLLMKEVLSSKAKLSVYSQLSDANYEELLDLGLGHIKQEYAFFIES